MLGAVPAAVPASRNISTSSSVRVMNVRNYKELSVRDGVRRNGTDGQRSGCVTVRLYNESVLYVKAIMTTTDINQYRQCSQH